MCDVIAYRGPDESGYYVDDMVSIGMRRLSIIDLVSGSQPVFNEEGDIAVVFNGEIYNFRELRDELEQKGHRFITKSDTEVIVHAYEEYGHDCLNRFNGMFAIALWDMKKSELFLARDRFGIKPLYYALVDGIVIFGSEIKSIIEYGIKRQIDERALSEYFTLRYVPAPRTMFRNVKKLEPGCFMTIRSSGVEIKKYWNLDYTTVNKSEGYFKEKVLATLEDSVKSRLISDVPVGVFLSGGLDSSIITALTCELSSEPVKTFSVGFYGAKYDETPYSRNVAEHFETEHTEEWVDIENVNIIPKLMYHLDEPLADPAILPTYLISETASKKVKVVLSGEGGDEAFAGYDRYSSEIRMRNISKLIPDWFKKMSFGIGERVSEGSVKKYMLYLGSRTTQKNSYYYRMKLRDNGHLNSDILNLGDEDGVSDLFYNSDNYLNSMLKFDIDYWLPDDLLMKVDKMTMANSLEARVPLLDHNLLQLMCSAPPSLKLNKYLLKASVKDIVPKNVIQRKKHGFDVPISEWFKGDTLDEYLSDDRIMDTPYLNSSEIEDVWSRHRTGRGDYSVLLWKCLCYVGWFDTFKI